MRVNLLYRDRDPDRLNGEAYYDPESIIKDLGLERLFLSAGQRVILEHGEVKLYDKEDPYISETMRKVMMIPLASAEETVYRQEVMKDCLRQEEILRELYRISSETLMKWDVLGRGAREKTQQRNPAVKLTEELLTVQLFCDSLKEIRELFTRKNPQTGKTPAEECRSEGFRGLYERLCAAFPEERENTVRKVLADVSFFTDGGDESDPWEQQTLKPRIVLECGLEDGLKFSSMKLAEVSSEPMRFYRPGTTMKKLQEFRYSRIPDSFSVERDMHLNEQAKLLEFGVVSYLKENILGGVLEEFRPFFDRLKRQTAFYLGAVQLIDHIRSRGMDFCFPEVSDRETLEFRELRECVTGLERRVKMIGNTCSLNGERLLIVTGANQGGKSTFLRSIGIAQVMMQSGLPVAAEAFRGGLFPRIFVHFTRREDSSMNSGRLDEELGRMNRIVEQIGDGSLLLLNESFATTTEKEGSVIAYDIVRALTEAGAKILMVTHLLSFAKRVYEETKDDPESGAAFLSAERKPDGTRTFRMIRHTPEMTSFGLDLYEEIVEKKKY